MMEEFKAFGSFLMSMIAFSVFVLILLIFGTILTVVCLSWVLLPVAIYVFELSPWWLIGEFFILSICRFMYYTVQDARVKSSKAPEPMKEEDE